MRSAKITQINEDTGVLAGHVRRRGAASRRDLEEFQLPPDPISRRLLPVPAELMRVAVQPTEGEQISD